MDRLFPGDVSERPKEHAWKACVVQATAGSNPAVTAKMLKGLTKWGPSAFLADGWHVDTQAPTPPEAPRGASAQLADSPNRMPYMQDASGPGSRCMPTRS